MTQASIGQVENLKDLVSSLESVREAVESACQELIAVAESKYSEAQAETKISENILEAALQAESEARGRLESAENDLSSAESALASCEAQPIDEDGRGPCCYGEAAAVSRAQSAVAAAQSALETAIENRQSMQERVDIARQALSTAEKMLEQTRSECFSRMGSISTSIAIGRSRLTSAYQALEAYLATNPSAAQFNSWLNWSPGKGKLITPDVINARLNLSIDQQRMLHEYLYDRNPAYRDLVSRYRSEWANAKCDVERNMINRKSRIHISGQFAEQLARHALSPLGGKVETQGRTFVGDGGRYTRTDLLVTGLYSPVVLGRGEGMGAPAGGSIAFEVKCGKPDYLYSQKDHMQFQAEGHKNADAHCTLCSRDIHDLSKEKEAELREALRVSGSPMVGMLPEKNEIDRSCLEFIHADSKES